jgi:hypothetical protein
VCRVSRQKPSACGELIYVARMHFVGREPFDIMNIEFEFCFVLDSRFDFLIQNVACVFVKFFGKDADDAIPFFAFERKENNK